MEGFIEKENVRYLKELSIPNASGMNNTSISYMKGRFRKHADKTAECPDGYS